MPVKAPDVAVRHKATVRLQHLATKKKKMQSHLPTQRHPNVVRIVGDLIGAKACETTEEKARSEGGDAAWEKQHSTSAPVSDIKWLLTSLMSYLHFNHANTVAIRNDVTNKHTWIYYILNSNNNRSLINSKTVNDNTKHTNVVWSGIHLE